MKISLVLFTRSYIVSGVKLKNATMCESAAVPEVPEVILDY